MAPNEDDLRAIIHEQAIQLVMLRGIVSSLLEASRLDDAKIEAWVGTAAKSVTLGVSREEVREAAKGLLVITAAARARNKKQIV